MSAVQLTIDFDPAIGRRYDTLEDVVRDAYGTSRRKKKDIAADCDQAPSTLARMVYRGDGLKLGLDDFERLLDAMPDTRAMVLDYLIGRYLERDDARQQRAAQFILTIAPAILEAAEALKGKPS